MSGAYEARVVAGGMPTDCCDYGVVSLELGVEVCRVWREEDARQIANLLNTRATPAQPLDAATVERYAQVARELRAYRADQPDEEYVTVAGGLVDDAIRALATEPHQHGGKGA